RSPQHLIAPWQVKDRRRSSPGPPVAPNATSCHSCTLVCTCAWKRPHISSGQKSHCRGEYHLRSLRQYYGQHTKHPDDSWSVPRSWQVLKTVVKKQRYAAVTGRCLAWRKHAIVGG